MSCMLCCEQTAESLVICDASQQLKWVCTHSSDLPVLPEQVWPRFFKHVCLSAV